MGFDNAYWSRGVGQTKRAEPFVFVLIFFATFLHQGKKVEGKKSGDCKNISNTVTSTPATSN
jgi:hypothetical protein